MLLEAALMASSWGVQPSDVRTDTTLTRWVERQVEYIEDHFGLQLPKIEVIEMPAGEMPGGRRSRRMAVGNLPGMGRTIIAVSDDMLEEYGPAELHFVVRHEVAHMVDIQQRGHSDETSPEFRAVCERLGAPLSGRATDSSGYENAKAAVANAEPEVLDFVSKGL